jgi:hypothetical protein
MRRSTRIGGCADPLARDAPRDTVSFDAASDETEMSLR